MSEIACLFALLVSPAFLCLTGVTLISTWSPPFQELASHGKTRITYCPGTRNIHTVTHSSKSEKQRSNSWLLKSWQSFLYGSEFLVNKKFFLHFYIAGLLSLCLFLYDAYKHKDENGMHNLCSCEWPAIFLLLIHLLRRSYECICVHRYSQNSKMHLAGYICGMFHYTFLPFILLNVNGCCCEFAQNGNAKIAKIVFDNTQHENCIGISLYQFVYIILCLWGQLEQYYHHQILSNLRPPASHIQRSEESMKDNAHKLPKGRWFHHIACPHYLAEIIIYISLVLLLQAAKGGMKDHIVTNHTCETNVPFADFLKSMHLLPVLLKLREHRCTILLLWVSTNLTVTAIRSHMWYAHQFPGYDKLQRKAILPFLI